MPGGLTCRDWRDVPRSVMARLYQAEVARWADQLEWDSAQDWQEVETGRRLGTVSGLVVTDEAEEVAGWTYFLVHNRTLQIGTVVSSAEACTKLLFDTVLESPLSDGVEAVTCFALSGAPGVVSAARSRGLMVGRYWYLARAAVVGFQGAPPRDARPWRIDDMPATADLLSRAYGPSDGSRPFAPRGSAEEWGAYVAQVASARGCGTLMTAASWCVPAGPARLAAVALTSRVSSHTGHLVQLAVDPQFQAKGVGGALLEAACGSAARVGCTRMTLLVAGGNRRARRLYDGAGFTPTASFVSAGSLGRPVQPRRLTSVALAERLTTFR